MIPSDEGGGAWSPEPDADPERTILRPDHIEDRPRSGCKIVRRRPRASSPRSSGIRGDGASTGTPRAIIRATLLTYIWGDEYWLGAYKVPDFQAEAREVGRVVQFHPPVVAGRGRPQSSPA
jgi:hypothetical protein